MPTARALDLIPRRGQQRIVSCFVQPGFGSKLLFHLATVRPESQRPVLRGRSLEPKPALVTRPTRSCGRAWALLGFAAVISGHAAAHEAVHWDPSGTPPLLDAKGCAIVLKAPGNDSGSDLGCSITSFVSPTRRKHKRRARLLRIG